MVVVEKGGLTEWVKDGISWWLVVAFIQVILIVLAETGLYQDVTVW